MKDGKKIKVKSVKDYYATAAAAQKTPDYPALGQEIVDLWEADITRVSKKSARNADALRKYGIATTGIGALTGSINAGIKSDSDVKNVTWGASIITTIIGIIQLFQSDPNNSYAYLDDSRDAIRLWKVSDRGLQAYTGLLNSLDAIRKKYRGYGDFEMPTK
jgi:hypothetical protein